MVYVLTADQTRIYYECEGQGSTALLFVHGWLGHGQWWNVQRDSFMNQYTVVRMDLPGHGKSEFFKNGTSSQKYAAAIQAVADQVIAPSIILVGHSMAGAYVLEASLSLPKVKGIVLVDTLKNLDQLISYEQAEDMMFNQYRKDFKFAVENALPQYLFVSSTPVHVREKLQREFLASDPNRAIQLLEPLYKMDIQSVARRVTVPVRAINSEYIPTNLENNRKYLSDYDFVSMSGTGHYPMLEQPDEFNRLLGKILKELS